MNKKSQPINGKHVLIMASINAVLILIVVNIDDPSLSTFLFSELLLAITLMCNLFLLQAWLHNIRYDRRNA